MEIQRACQSKLTAIDELCAEIERTKGEIISREHFHLKEAEKYAREIEGLKSEIASKEELTASNIKELEAERFELQRKVETLQLKIKGLNEDQFVLLNSMTELEALVQDLQDRRAGAEAEASTLKHLLNSQKTHFEDKMTGLSEKFIQTFHMQTTPNTLEEAFDAAAATLTRCHQRVEDLQLLHTEYEQRIACLDAEIAAVTLFMNF